MTFTGMQDIIDRITEGRSLPEGADSWALKATDFAGRTRSGFEWPIKGWVSAPGPFKQGGPIPHYEGDGLCVARTYAGIALGGYRALALLLVAYAAGDVLGEDRDKVRVKRAFVVERLDGEDVLRRYGTGVDLHGADLAFTDLHGADLTDADLSDADLRGASLIGANLTGADLHGANLARANLAGANLAGADLAFTDLSGADLSGADLSGADLSNADLTNATLHGANLSGADLTGAILDSANQTGVLR